jgi:hypothetical protein
VVIAHISGVPVEKLLPLASGGGAIWAAARAWTSMRARRPATPSPSCQREDAGITNPPLAAPLRRSGGGAEAVGEGGTGHFKPHG